MRTKKSIKESSLVGKDPNLDKEDEDEEDTSVRTAGYIIESR